MGERKMKFSELNGTKQWWSSVKTVVTLRVLREQVKSPPTFKERSYTRVSVEGVLRRM
jgi:hypothetical protein